MSKQNKWAGSFGKVASGGSSTSGGNSSGKVGRVPAPRANSSKSQNVIKMPTGPGDNLGQRSGTTHNDINAFTRGIKSRGPYTGPSFGSINNSKAFMQEPDSSYRSAAKNPSSGAGESAAGIPGGHHVAAPPRNLGSAPTGGPSSRSINNSYKIMQGNNPSTFNLPSGSSMRRGSTDGSGTGMTKSPQRTGSGKAMGTRTSGTKDNKNGSGYQASVR